MEIDFGDAVVDTIELDYALVIRLAPSGRIRIEVPVLIEDAGETRLARVGEVDLTGDTTFDDLPGRSVDEAEAAADGTLAVTFSNGLRVVARVDRGYESWEVAVRGGAMYFGGPELEATYVAP